MRMELTRLQETVGITFISLPMIRMKPVEGQRIAVIDKGAVQQIATLPNSMSTRPPASWLISLAR